MTDQLQRLRDDAARWLSEAEADIRQLEDRVQILIRVLQRIDDAIAASGNPVEPIDETERRREKRDIRGAVLAVLQEYGPHEAKVIKTYVERKIGELTDSALARTFTSLVGDGSVIETGGIFSRPVPSPYAVASEAAK